MKKLFLTLTMLLFAFTGVMRAGVDVEVGTASTTSTYLPDYTYYDYHVSQQIYTAAEIGLGGTINAISFDVASGSAIRSLNVFMKHVTRSSFTSNSNWEVFAADEAVFSGDVTWGAGWVTITLDTPFEYNGTDNLLVCVQDVTGDYVSSPSFRVYNNGSNTALYKYRDGTPLNLSSMPNGTRNNYKNHIKLNVELGPATITADVNPVDLGNRPNGAWMKPATFNLVNVGNNAVVTAIESSNAFFGVTSEVPFNVNFGEPVAVEVTTGTGEIGDNVGQLMVIYADRSFTTIDVTASAYAPVDGDVWEKAITVTDMPFQGNAPAGIFKNYDLPTATAGADAVYKVTFDEDVLFSAGTPGDNAAAAIYTEDFNGAEGPMADNNYEYIAPEMPEIPSVEYTYDFETADLMGWSTVDADGDGETWESATPAAYGMGSAHSGTYCASSWSWNSYSMDPDNWMISPMVEGAASIQYYVATNNSYPDHYGVYASSTGTNTSDFTLLFDETAGAKGGNGGTKASMTNGGSRDMSTWAERNIELPAGTKYVAFRHWNSYDNNYLFIDDVTITCSAVRGNRDAQTLTVYDGSATNGYVPVYGFYADAYLKCQYVMAEDQLTDMVGSTINSMTFYLTQSADAAWTGTFSVYMGEYSATTINNFSNADYQVVYNGTLDATGSTMVVTFTNPYEYNGGNLLIGFNQVLQSGNYPSAMFAGEEVTGASVQGYHYNSLSDITATQRNFVPKTTFTYEAATPEPPTPTYQIADMFVPAGTYYVVVASTTDNFQVDMAVADAPVPEPAIAVSPADGAVNVASPVTLSWQLGAYTTEYQVLFGTQYPPVNVLVDWTDELATSALAGELVNNQSYFWQVNERNASGTTNSEIFAFTTAIDPVEGFAVENDSLYPGDAAVFTWEANRSFKGYNLYCDGVKVNESLITTNTYAVEGLEYNMEGYNFQVSAVYDAGESALSDVVTVTMTGNGTVSGYVYDTDVDHPVAFATVGFLGLDEYMQETYTEFTTDEEGFFTGELLAGLYAAGVISEGYATEAGAQVVAVEYGQSVEDLVFITHEFYYPLNQITATEEENDVLVEWSWTPAELIVDFETGDFSQADFTLPATYPWAICNNAHEGTYAIKSTCEGQASASSIVEATVDVPYDGKMGFWVSVSSESNYDKFHFYIDGVEKGTALSGTVAYTYKEFDVTEGTHTYKWEYAKDGSVNSGDDCAYVDDITLYRYEAPLPPVVGATEYNFDDNTMMGWTSIDADNDGNGWVSSANPGIYHNSGVSLSGTGHNASEAYVISGSYANQTGAVLYPDNYLVTPAAISAENGAQIRFYACAQDASYAAEHFGVAVSTTTATASAFTTIQEWTMTAKGNGVLSEGRGRQTRQGEWYEYTVDLSSYAGQDIWVAIRHFNCSDQFILNVDDITVATGGSKNDRGNRSLVSYNLYRRNNYNDEVVTLAEGLASDVMEYTDNAWNGLTFGEYQWGIQATYDGYAVEPETTRDEYTYSFEGGLDGWTSIVINSDGGDWIHSDDNLGGYDYTELAHTGTGFAMCYSYVDYQGAYNTDAYLVSPQKYSVDASSTISFWADNANDSYPENFSVCVSTAANPTASDFVQIWNGGAKGANVEKAAVRHSDNRYENWRSHEISLAAYAGQEIWIAFHDVNYDQYEIWIDDVTITAGSGTPTPPVPPTPGPTGAGLSEILWSNVIEKDMEATLTFTITLNNGQSPAGATIEIFGEQNYTVTAEGATTEVVVRKAHNYDMTVALPGYTSWSHSGAVEADETFNITLNEQILPVDGLYVSPTGWATWDGIGGTPAPGPGPQPGGSSFTEGFEGGMPEGWTVINANGDGYTWCLTSAIPTTWTYYASMSLDWYRSGSNAICSGSYINGAGALNPDEYLVTPMVNIQSGSTLSFWAAATDASYPADHFGVFVSDDANTWTSVQEWTLTAKGTRNGGRESRDGKGAKLGSWYNYSVDLSSYAGDKYLAIRHFNCYDQYIMCVDDIELGVVNKGDEDAPIKYIVKLDGVVEGETTFTGFQHNVAGMEEGSTHVTAVRPVYINGNGDWMEYTWTYTSCEHFAGVDDLEAAQQGNDVKLTWTMPGTPGPGPGPQPGGSSFTEGFEGGLNGWNVLTMIADGGSWIHSNDNLGGYDYTSHAHGGSGFAMCYSFVDYVGAFNTDSYMYTPEMYTISNGSTLTFWADNANDSYPESFSVVISSVANPSSAADFTTVWSGSAKGTRSNGAMVRHSDNRYDNWRSHTVDLSAYAGQTVYIGFHDVNYDMYEVWIDDVELTSGAKLGGTLSAAGVGFGTANNALTDDGNWYYYDNGINEDAIGTGGGQFWWGIMLPAGDYEGNSLTKVAAYDYMAMTGTASIYQGGTTAPEGVALGTVNVTMTGSENFVEYEFAEPVAIDPTQNVWVVFYNASGATYPAAVCANTGDANGRWVSLDGATWDDLAGYGLDNTFMIRAYIEAGSGPAPQPVEGILGAMIFQDDEPIAFVAGNPTEYVVEGAASYDATYSVRVVYGGELDVTYYAMSCPEEVDYIAPSVSVEEISANTVIYPNPTHDNVTIEAKGMRHITVVSALGQVVYDADIEADMTQMNLGQFKAGLYLVRIATENGTVVKRVTVVK